MSEGVPLIKTEPPLMVKGVVKTEGTWMVRRVESLPCKMKFPLFSNELPVVSEGFLKI